jgi:hypothetical protein
MGNTTPILCLYALNFFINLSRVKKKHGMRVFESRVIRRILRLSTVKRWEMEKIA